MPALATYFCRWFDPRAIFALFAISGCAAPTFAASDPPVWKAGVSKIKITPEESIWMAGFGNRNKPSEGVRQDIYVKALALEDETKSANVIVTLDLVSIDRETAGVIADKCREKFGLPRERLLLNVSHTHSGPVAGISLMPLYELTPDQREVVRRYTLALIEKVVASVGAALDARRLVKLEFGQGLAGIAVNRRRVARRDLPGPVDHDVPVLSAREPDGRLIAVAVGYACHATALNDYRLSNDWPVYALANLEAKHAGTVALFVQGCGADANPLPRGDEGLARIRGELLAAATEQVLSGKMQTVRGPLRSAFGLADVAFQPAPSRAELERRLADPNRFIRLHATRLLSVLERDGKLPSTYPYPVQVWQFGDGLKLIALGGEVVVDYALRLKTRYGFEQTWVAGYSNDILAYIPSRRVWQEGGYESGDAMIYFGQPAAFEESVEERIVEKVHELVQQVSSVKIPAPAK
jgi:neutral ceramidase